MSTITKEKKKKKSNVVKCAKQLKDFHSLSCHLYMCLKLLHNCVIILECQPAKSLSWFVSCKIRRSRRWNSEVVIYTIKLEIVWKSYCTPLYMQLKTWNDKIFSSCETVERHSLKNWSGLASSVTKSMKISLLIEGLWDKATNHILQKKSSANKSEWFMKKPYTKYTHLPVNNLFTEVALF